MGFIFYFVSLIWSAAVLLKIYTKYLVKYCKSKVCLVGKTVIVTGGNAGIGYESALSFAQRGARVILACRNEQRGSKAVDNIIKLTENKNVVLKLLDLSSKKSIRNFAKDILDNEERIDILVNNAGIIFIEGTSEDGLHVEWQTNYFGPVLVTLLLLDLLKKTAPSRIINVSSVAAKYAKKLSVEALSEYRGHFQTYSDTKLCNIFFTQELAKKLKGTNISVYSLHPGVVQTDIVPMETLAFFMRPIKKPLTKLFCILAEEGAQTTIYCACEQNIEHLTGSHFEYCDMVSPYKTAEDSDLAKKIWDATLKIIKFDKIE